MHTIDSKGLANQAALNQQSEASQEKTSSGGIEKLPNLLVSGAEAARQSAQGNQAGTDTSQFNKSMEFMMMKRLNFLRNSLDSHNPHETTLRMRDNA